MSDLQQNVQSADQQMQQQARRVAEQPWVEKLARFGYAAKGIVYALIGILAVQAAIGAGGATTDSQGALQAINGQPFGQFLLALVAIGLIGYALWRVIQAALDTENKGSKPGGIATRIGYVISGVTYGGLALAAARLAMGNGGNSDNTTGMTARVMALPLGRILVVLAGLVIIGVGCYEIYRAATRGFEDELNHLKMSQTEQRWATRSGLVGLAAHGLVFGLTGLIIVIAALRQTPEQAQGIDAALTTLAQQPYGPWLLGIVAVGLVAYGVFSLVQARYRKMIFT